MGRSAVIAAFEINLALWIMIGCAAIKTAEFIKFAF